MKKILLSAFLAAALGASEYNYEVSAMGGEASSNNSQELQDHGVYGVEMQFNNLGTVLKPELSVLYSNADYNGGRGDTNIFRTALNGVYEFEKSNIITPFVKLGAGYETMSNHQYDNHNSLFGDVGAGVKIALVEQLSLKLEVIDMLKFNNFNWDNNLLLMAGLNFAFGEKVQPAAPVAAPVVVAPEAPKPEPKPEPAVIAVAPAPVIAAPIDSDKDGVFDPQDKCPNTPTSFKVDADGCPVKATLHLHFVSDSSLIDSTGRSEINGYAQFLKENPVYKVTVIGYTDSTASEEHNQKLSQRRAEAVKKTLIEQGVAADRLTSIGEGEKAPIATNATKEGRLENRRIEIELCK